MKNKIKLEYYLEQFPDSSKEYCNIVRKVEVLQKRL